MSFWQGTIFQNSKQVEKLIDTNLNNDSKIMEKCDEYLNIFFTGMSVKIIRIVNNLTKALENSINKFEVVKTENFVFQNEIDRLRAMLKVRSGKFVEYQKKVNELNDLGMQLTKEASELKSTFVANKSNKGVNFSQSYKKIFALNKLMRKLQSKLNNDYEALITAGNPDFAEYLKRITGLNVFCRSNLNQTIVIFLLTKYLF